jgi:hypothetical protein
MRGGAVYFNTSNNLHIENNDFVNNYTTIIYVGRNSDLITINKNHFESNGLSLNYSCCIHCEGNHYIISNNSIVDFGYCAIRCGVWYQSKEAAPSKGVIEYNVIYYSDDYLNAINNHGLIDSGAIYIATKNDDVIARYNFINNISGAGANRGIYCDDGAKNFTLYGNIILNIHNGRCIDARNDASLELFDKNEVANINKVMEYNIYDGSVKFHGKAIQSNGCIKGVNFITNHKETDVIYDYANMEKKEDDIVINIRRVRGTKIVVDWGTRRVLRQTPAYEGLKKYISIW